MPIAQLPVEAHLPAIRSALKKEGRLILRAEPGAGKSTLVPLDLVSAGSGRVLVLQPRRVAARSLANWMAELSGRPLGEFVGYQVRFEKRWGPQTRVLLITEALLLQWLARDPELKGVDAVVLDEFHERSFVLDLCLAMCRDVQASLRPDLKILVMSATMDMSSVASYLDDAPRIDVPGRAYPVEIVNRGDFLFRARAWGRVGDLHRNLAGSIRDAVEAHGTKNTLVFLPGRRDLALCRRELEASGLGSQFEICELSGSSSPEEVQRATRPWDGSRRRLILATNVAETSVTLPDLDLVVDSGAHKAPSFDPELEVETLEVSRISAASAAQRAGRAGRTGPGTCVRLWPEIEQNLLRPFDPPEIHMMDAVTPVLWAYSWSTNFSWLEAPSKESLNRSLKSLLDWGALDSEQRLTARGRALLGYPLSVRAAALIAERPSSEELRLSLWWENQDKWRVPGPRARVGSDVPDIVSVVQREEGVSSWAQSQLRQLESVKVGARSSGDSLHERPTELTPALWAALRSRVCYFPRGELRGRSVTGAVVELSEDSACVGREFVLPLRWHKKDTGRVGVELGHGLTREEFMKLARSELQEEVTFQEPRRSGAVVMLEDLKTGSVKCFRGLEVSTATWKRASDEELGAWAQRFLSDHWQDLVREVSALAQLVRALKKAGLEVWSAPGAEEFAVAVQAVGAALPRGSWDLEGTPWREIWEQSMDYGTKKLWSEQAPRAWTAPNGRAVPVVYSESGEAVLEARLQWFLGLDVHPRIGGSPATLVLLGPHGRPIQVTQDLPRFWRGSYAEIRKEMRGRYPKHAWPEDPTAVVIS